MGSIDSGSLISSARRMEIDRLRGGGFLLLILPFLIPSTLSEVRILAGRVHVESDRYEYVVVEGNSRNFTLTCNKKSIRSSNVSDRIRRIIRDFISQEPRNSRENGVEGEMRIHVLRHDRILDANSSECLLLSEDGTKLRRNATRLPTTILPAHNPTHTAATPGDITGSVGHRSGRPGPISLLETERTEVVIGVLTETLRRAPEIFTNAIDMVSRSVQSDFVERISQAILAGVPPMVTMLSTLVLRKTLPNDMADALAHTLSSRLVPHLANTITPSVVGNAAQYVALRCESLLHRYLRRDIPREVRDLPSLVVDEVVRSNLTLSLTNSIAHSVVQTLTSALTKKRGTDSRYYSQYHATYYSDYYAQYYGEYYSQAYKNVREATGKVRASRRKV